MTRVLMTTDTVGGVWTYCVAMAGALCRDGVEVRLATLGPAPSADRLAQASRAGASHIHLDAPLDWLAGDERALAAGRARIAEATGAWGADIVQINQPAYAAGACPAPVVAVAHSCVETWWRGTHGCSAPPEWDWHRRAVGSGLRQAAVAVAPSRSFAATLQRVYRLPRAPLAVPNGAAGGPHPGVKEPFVLASGRVWDASKNFRLLDDAAASIDWPVRLAGEPVAPDGASGPELRHVGRLGKLSAEAMARQYAASSIYVSPSLCEPFGLGVLEAAQAGAALVLSDIDTFRELWDGAALFFDPRDAAALAATVNRLVRDAALRRQLALAARGRATLYGIADAARRMRAVYESAAKAHPAVVA